MKPKVLEIASVKHNGVKIVVKSLLLRGKPEERYFIYKRGFNTCGGYGWKSVERMWNYYQWWSTHGRKEI